MALIPKTEDGKPIVSFWPTEGSKSTYISHDWTDRTTWTTGAVRMVDEVPTRLGLGYPPGTYRVAHNAVIDTFHGKITDEDFLKDAAGNSFRVVVTVDGVMKLEADPDDGGNDYSIDYALGTITFGV